MLIFFFFQWNVLTDIKGICYFPNNPIRINFQNNHDHFYSSLRCISWDHVGVHMSIWTYLAKQREQLQTKLMLQRRTCGSPPKDRPLSCDKGIGWFKSGLEQEKGYNWASTQRGRSVKKAFRKKKKEWENRPCLYWTSLDFFFCFITKMSFVCYDVCLVNGKYYTKTNKSSPHYHLFCIFSTFSHKKHQTATTCECGNVGFQ